MAEAADFPLHEQVQRLFTLLNNRGIRYLLVGGVALLRYVDGRNTEDLDLILSVESLKQVPELSIVDQNTNFARARFDGLRVDLLLRRTHCSLWSRNTTRRDIDSPRSMSKWQPLKD